MGLDGLANYYAHKFQSGSGPLVYFWSALKAILTFQGSVIELLADGIKTEQKLLMVTACNGKWEGGTFHVAPNADMRDGLIDLLIVEKIPIHLLVTYLIRFQKGPSHKMKGIRLSKTKSIELFSKKGLAVHSDGEHLGSDIRHLKLSIKSKVLSVIVPRNDY